MTPLINWPSGSADFGDTDYWHLSHRTLPDQFNLLQHNIRVGNGVVPSISFAASIHGLAGATTLYNLANSEQLKEQVFEETRARHFSYCPSRRNAFFLFESEEDACRARREFFPNEDREFLRVWIERTALTHVADAKYLDGERDEWQSNAQHYWNGDRTANPFLEVIVHGLIYFPDWRNEQGGA